MHPSWSILNQLSWLLCRLMQVDLPEPAFSTSTMVSGFPDWSTLTLERAQVLDSTTTHPIGISWPLWRLWSNCVTALKERIIRASYNATIRRSNIFTGKESAPRDRLDVRKSSLRTTSLLNLWNVSRMQWPDQGEDATMRLAMRIWRQGSWPP